MQILSKLQTLWTNFMSWYLSPWITFEKVKKSHITLILVLLFIAVPVVTFYVELVTDYNWIEQKLHPKVSIEQQEIDVINKKLGL